MHVLLPPSETKREGGSAPFHIDALVFPELHGARRRLRDALVALSEDPAAAAKALKLGPRQLGEIERNAALAREDVTGMPAVDRFTGVLFEALDAPSLNATARRYLHEHVLVHSALWGPVAGLDAVPAYRLSHDSRVPGSPLRRYWSAPVSAALATVDGLVLDLRSDAYAALGPLPPGSDGWTVRLRTRTADGRLRALNHFNKRGKGRFVRSLAEDRVDVATVPELIDWASGRGYVITVSTSADSELDLVLDEE